MTVVWQMLSVYKEASSLLLIYKMAAVGMDINVYRYSQALRGFFQVKFSRARTYYFSLVELLVYHDLSYKIF